MWASSASRLWECWLPDERPAPNWVRTVSAICAAPPVMNGILAAWLSSWSRQTPTKSRYISSTTGRMPAIAAPTPTPMIAVSEIGVSRTRSPNRSRRPRVSPKTLPPSPTSMPATNTRSSSVSSASSASCTASIVRNIGTSPSAHRRTPARGHRGRGRERTKSNSDRRRPGSGRARAAVDRGVELRVTTVGLERRAAITSSARCRPRGSAGGVRRRAGRGCLPLVELVGCSGSARGRPRSGRATGRWRPRR